MRYFCVFLSILFMGSLVAVAQDSAPAAASAAKPSTPGAKKDKADNADKPGQKVGKKGADKKDADKKEDAKPAGALVELKGDVITLKSGSQLKGVKVVSRTANEVEIEAGSGVRMRIPRRQIQDIQIDTSAPKTSGPAGGSAPKEDAIFPGSKMKPEVLDKLSAPIKEPVKYENTDLVKVVGELSQRFGVQIDVDDSVKALPENARTLGFEAKPGATALSILQEELLKKSPGLEIVYQFDKLLLTTKEKAAQLNAAAQPPAAAPAPAAPAPAPAAPAPAPAPAAPAAQ